MKRTILLIIILLVLLLCQTVEAGKMKWNIYSNYQWESLTLNKNSLWNPGLLIETGPVTTSSCFSLNLETRWKWGESKWVVSPLLTVNGEGRVDIRLRECFLTFEKGNFEITAGRGIIKLGTGYMFTPISAITPERSIADPEDSLRSNRGVDLLKMDYYRENLNISAMVFKKESWKNAALLVYYHWQGIDWYGIVYYPEHKKWEWGAAFSTTIGNRVEIHGEWMQHKQSPAAFHPVYFENDPYITYPTPPLYDPGTGHYHEYLLGTSITFKNLNIIAEYYHKDWGLKPVWWDRLKTYYQFNFENTADPLQSTDILSGLSVIRQGTRGLMQDYLFVRASTIINKNTDLSGILFINLHDASTVAILQLENRLTEGIYLYLKPMFFIGKQGTEFKESWYCHSLHLGVRGVF
jgi:hypothetical protein